MVAEAQMTSPEDRVRNAQSAFWAAFNVCDREAMARLFTEEVEFYHDREGENAGRDAVTATMLAGRCDPASDRHVRREAIPDSETVHLFAGGHALVSGEHRFLATAGNDIERHDSIARYEVLWRDAPSGWRMHRVVSYDHRPDLPHLASVATTTGQLEALTGTYLLADGTVLPLSLADGTLRLGEGERAFALVPLGEGRFGVRERWLQFRLGDGRIEVFDEGRLVAAGSKEVE